MASVNRQHPIIIMGRRRRVQVLLSIFPVSIYTCCFVGNIGVVEAFSVTKNRPVSSNLCSATQDNDVYYSPNVPLEERSEEDGPNAEESSITNEYSFFDEAIIYVRAGSGGQGSSTYKKMGKNQNGPPDGGNGGNGGNVILQIDPSLNTLAGLTRAWRPNSFGGSGATAMSSASSFRPKSFRAENGADGGRQFKNGAYGKDTVIRVPPGTVVQEQIESKKGETFFKALGSLTIATEDEEEKKSESLVVALGGQGGEGSGVQTGRGVRRPRLPSTGGERKLIKLTLKIVADVALVGVPNAGKSTLLAAVTRAKPKIANYPFTTVIPNLGVWIPSSALGAADNNGSKSATYGSGSEGLVLCDVPGLIAGAAQGVGLGHAFLRHVERCHVILHLVDATSNDPVADYRMLNKEIVKYGTGQLASMPQVVVINKMDVYDDDDEGGSGEDWEEGLKVRWTKSELETLFKEAMPHSRLMWMSAKEKDGVDDLMARLAAFVRKVKVSKASQLLGRY